MKSQIEFIDFMYNAIDNSSLKNEVSGSIYKYKKPNKSNLEDIVINSLTAYGIDVQKGILNVNIYVPNINALDSSLPNTARLEELSGILLSEISELTLDNCSIYIEAQNTIEEIDTGFHF
jgi:two-component SAPR family response regulator